MRIPWAAGLGVCVLLAGGAAQRAAEQEEMLSAAGFHLLPINSSQRAASANTLPPNELVRTVHNGQMVWVYSDPNHCGCLYVGDEPAYQRYAAFRVQRQTALIQEQAAQLNSMNWGPWSPWGVYGPLGPWGW